jgi:methylthioribose-1-phosphate isomerase
VIRTVFWENNAVVMIDQKALPLEMRYVTCRHYREVVAAIQDMTIRGAPAIGVAAAMGIALGVRHLVSENIEGLKNDFMKICDEFSRTRPTARNLFWAIERMKQCFEKNRAEGADIQRLKTALVAEAVRVADEDVQINRRIGANGSQFVKDGANILTHCNAGALATAGYGTALGIIRTAREQGKTVHVYVDETRPMLQGARLTCWELKEEDIPATLITDSMAGFLMSRGKIDLVIVGADRIAANGDTANKIGTYTLAVLAGANKIPFYVAAPLSTIDLGIKNGKAIPIEERAEEEVASFRGMRTAPEGIDVYNPAFDVTPSLYITAVITEAGTVRRPFKKGLKALCNLEGCFRSA